MVIKIVRFLRRQSRLIDLFFFRLAFIRNNRYIPNFKMPITYNEKVNYRKFNSTHPLFSICSDKIKVKDWVGNLGYKDILIETLFIGKSIDVNKVKDLVNAYGDVLIKANHNSGPVFLITVNTTDEVIAQACYSINLQLEDDYGKLKNEPWYSDIRPQVLVEKRIFPEKNEADLKDYKFHVFQQKNGAPKILLHIDFDRSNNHHRSFFDESGQWLPFSMKYPSLTTEIVKPNNFDRMLDIAKKLAEPFSYVRVDLYNVNGDIYFGELTFAHGSGAEKFTSPIYDRWLGELWECDPSN